MSNLNGLYGNGSMDSDGWISFAEKPAPPESSAGGSFVRGAVRGVAPAAAGLAAGIPGAEVGFAVGGPIGALVGGLATGLPAAYAAAFGQEKVLQAAPGLASALGQSPEQVQADVQQHPYASMAGELAPNLAAFRPSLSAFGRTAGRSAKEVAAINSARVNGAVNAVVGGGMEAGQEVARGEPVDLTRVALATGMGALGQKETTLGSRIAGVGRAAMPARVREFVDSRLGRTQTEPVSDPVTETAPNVVDVQVPPITVPEAVEGGRAELNPRMQARADELQRIQDRQDFTAAGAFADDQARPSARDAFTESLPQDYNSNGTSQYRLFDDAAAPIVEPPPGTPGVAKAEPAAAAVSESAPVDTQTKDLFADKPTATVRSDFGPQEILLRLRSALKDENGFLPPTTSSIARVAKKLSDALASGDLNKAHDYLSSRNGFIGEQLEIANDIAQGRKYNKPAKARADARARELLHEQEALKAGLKVIEDYQVRMGDARSQEIGDAAEYGRSRAQPGAEVRQEFPESFTEQQMRERNAQQHADEQDVAEQAQLKGALADADRRVADSQAKQTAQRRDAILSQVLDDATTVNPYNRFIATLRKNGIRDLNVTPEEQARIRMFEQIKERFAGQGEESPPVAAKPAGESPAQRKLNRERAVADEAADQQWQRVQDELAPSPRQPRRVNPADRTNPDNFKLEPDPTGEDLARLERADAKRARQAAARNAQPEPEASDIPAGKQAEMFTSRGKPTAQAMGETRRQLIDEANRALDEVKGKKSKATMQEAVDAFMRKDMDIEAVRSVKELLQNRKYAEAERTVSKAGKGAAKASANTPVVEETSSKPSLREEVLAAKRALDEEQAASVAEPDPRMEVSRDLIQRAEAAGVVDKGLAAKLRAELLKDQPNFDMVDATIAENVRRGKAGQKKNPEIEPETDEARAAREEEEIRAYLEREPKERYYNYREAEEDGDSVRMRSSDETQGPVSREEAQKIVDEHVSTWANKPTVHVVGTFDELPVRFIANRERGFKAAYTSDGQLWVVADQHSSPADIKASIFHEALGHYGLAGKFGGRLQDMMLRMYRTNAKVRRLADAWLAKHGDNPAYADMSQEQMRARAAEEVLAEGSERGRLTSDGSLAAIWSQIKALVRDFARQIPMIGEKVGYSDNDVMQVLRQAHDYVAKGGEPAAAKSFDVQAKGAEVQPSKLRAATESTAERLFDKMSPEMEGVVRPLWEGLSYIGKRGITAWSFTPAVIDDAVNSGVRSAKDYMRAKLEQERLKKDKQLEVESTLQAFEKLPQNRRGTAKGTLNRFIFDSTTSTKWGFAPEWMEGFSPDRVDPEMARQFNALPKPEQQIVKDVFKYGYDTLREMKSGVLDAFATEYAHNLELGAGKELRKVFDEAYAKAADREKAAIDAFEAVAAAAKDTANAPLVAELRSKLAADTEKYHRLMGISDQIPYAPKRRFGKYVVVGRSETYMDAMHAHERGEMSQADFDKIKADSDHYIVDFATTAGEAAGLRRQLAERFGKDNAQWFEKEQAGARLGGDKDMFLAFQRLNKVMTNHFENLSDKKGLAQARTLVSDLYLSMLTEASSRKSELARKNVAGKEAIKDEWGMDMMRNFASKGLADAHFIGNLHKNGAVLDAINKMREQAGDQTATNREMRSMYVNELMMRHAVTMGSPNMRVANAVNRFTSMWMLAFSPGYYLQNLTQPHMMSLPYMAGRHGYTETWGHFNKAYHDLAPLLKSVKLHESLDLSTNIPADVQKVLHELTLRGLIDIGVDTDLGTWASQGNGKLTKHWNNVDRGLRNMVQKTETMNRLATSMAAYRAEYAKAIKAKATPDAAHTQAQEYAAEVIRQTHGNYDAFSAPRAFNSPVGKVLLQFKKFQLIQLGLLARLAKNSFAGGAEQEIARRSMGFLLGHTATMAGAMGLPGMAMLGWAYNQLVGDKDHPHDMELDLRRAIGDERLAQILLKGAPNAIHLDLSSRLGMGNALSLFPYTDMNKVDRDTYQNVLLAAAGPTIGGMLPRLIDGYSLVMKGDYYKGVEKLLPSGLPQGIAKAVRYANEGVTQANGRVLIDPEHIGDVEKFYTALGLTSDHLSNQQWARHVQQQFNDFYANRANEIKRVFTKAQQSNDAELRKQAQDDWMRLQQARKEQGLKPQPLSDLFKSYRTKLRAERSTVGGVAYGKRDKAFATELSRLSGGESAADAVIQ